MKIDFQNLNIAPMPNPKPLAVERVTVRIQSGNSESFSQGEGFIRNSSLHPDAILGRG